MHVAGSTQHKLALSSRIQPMRRLGRLQAAAHMLSCLLQTQLICHIFACGSLQHCLKCVGPSTHQRWPCFMLWIYTDDHNCLALTGLYIHTKVGESNVNPCQQSTVKKK